MRAAAALEAIERAMDAQLRAFTRMTKQERDRVVRAVLDSVYDGVKPVKDGAKAGERPRLPTLQGYQAYKARRDIEGRVARDPSLLRKPVAVLARMVTADRRSVRAWLRSREFRARNANEAGR